MIDERDLERSTEHVEAELEARLARHRARVRPGEEGRDTCTCGAPISVLRRTEFGAQLCVECQHIQERRHPWK